MAEGRETALRAALQVMHGREVDTPDILAIAEWLRSGKHPDREPVTMERLNAALQRDDLLRAIDDAQRDPNVDIRVDSLTRLIEVAGTIRREIGPS
jgi:hypothetical protein